MIAIIPAVPADAAVIHDIQMREPSWQGRGIGAALLRAVEQAHPAIQRFVLTTNTLVPGNVSFYERRGYRVAELTRHTDKIVLAQMVKVTGTTDA